MRKVVCLLVGAVLADPVRQVADRKLNLAVVYRGEREAATSTENYLQTRA